MDVRYYVVGVKENVAFQLKWEIARSTLAFFATSVFFPSLYEHTRSDNENDAAGNERKRGGLLD